MTARMHVVYDDEFGGIRLIAEDTADQLIVQRISDDANKVPDTPRSVMKLRTFATVRVLGTTASVELIPIKA